MNEKKTQGFRVSDLRFGAQGAHGATLVATIRKLLIYIYIYIHIDR